MAGFFIVVLKLTYWSNGFVKCQFRRQFFRSNEFSAIRYTFWKQMLHLRVSLNCRVKNEKKRQTNKTAATIYTDWTCNRICDVCSECNRNKLSIIWFSIATHECKHITHCYYCFIPQMRRTNEIVNVWMCSQYF